MLNFIFRLVLTVNATSWMVVIFGIKRQWKFFIFPSEIVGVCLLLIPVILSLVSIALFSFFSSDQIQNCRECVLADNEFLPVYLGYFFVALSVNDFTTLCFIYTIVFVFTFLTQTQYFNPIFLLFGYHFYHVMTKQGTRVFVIIKGKVIRNIQDTRIMELRRINDTTYIGKDKKK